METLLSGSPLSILEGRANWMGVVVLGGGLRRSYLLEDVMLATTRPARPEHLKELMVSDIF